tara:strand:+ start:853 stop:1062 length:210 start_codon:yes stop_codon:yes gene_type:complete
MKPSEILKQLNELRESYRKQGFSYTGEQRAQYDKLLQLRRDRVKYFYENDMVWKGGSKQLVDTKKSKDK